MLFPDPISFGVLTMAATLARKPKKPDVFDEVIEKRSAKSSHGPRPEFLNNTSTPAGIAANDPDAGERWQETPNAAVAVFDTDELMRHPDNREPTEEDILAKMQQFQKEGQLEPVVLWPPPKDWPHRQGEKLVIISGETRWHAAKRLGWTLQGRIAERLTPSEALERLAAYNGERRDLDPMQKARLINRLCQSVAEGGAGLTRQAAGERVGLESGAAASNLVRLLELPKKWQDRVASGELAWTWAREMIPYVPILDAMKEDLEHDWKNRETEQWDNAFLSRNDLVEMLDSYAEQVAPRIDSKHWIGNKQQKIKLDPADPETVKKLGIVEIELPTGEKGKTEKTFVATKAEACRELVKQAQAKATKSSAEKLGDDDKPAKRELTAAEKKQKAAERTKTLHARIAAWRQSLIRRELVCKLDDAADDGFRLVMAYLAGRVYTGPTAGELLEKASGVKSVRRDHDEVYWTCVADLPPGISRNSLTRRMALQLLAEEPTDWRRPILPPALVDGYAEDLEVDVDAAWRDLQIAGQGNKLAGEDLLEEFLLYHQTEELRELAKEMGKHVPETANRGAIVTLLLSIPRGTNQRLPLPKSIKPLAGVKTKKGKR